MFYSSKDHYFTIYYETSNPNIKALSGKTILKTSWPYIVERPITFHRRGLNIATSCGWALPYTWADQGLKFSLKLRAQQELKNRMSAPYIRMSGRQSCLQVHKVTANKEEGIRNSSLVSLHLCAKKEIQLHSEFQIWIPNCPVLFPLSFHSL